MWLVSSEFGWLVQNNAVSDFLLMEYGFTLNLAAGLR